MCVRALDRVSDRDGPSEGTDGDNNRGKRWKRGETDGRTEGGEGWRKRSGVNSCVKQSGFKSKVYQSVSA